MPAEAMPLVANPPSPFYRVALKALILDDRQRILVTKNDRNLYELPGGGWEHNESIAEGLARELKEEVGVSVKVDADMPRFVFQALSHHGYQALRIVYDARMLDPSQTLTPADGMVDARFVEKDEFLQLPLVVTDEPIKQYTDYIWS
ncbi:MAG: NUDIX hydrolase [Candidatus Saccharibacteria bacterium]